MKTSILSGSLLILALTKSQAVFAGFFGTFDPTSVPEPSTVALFAIGAAAVVVARINRKRKK